MAARWLTLAAVGLLAAPLLGQTSEEPEARPADRARASQSVLRGPDKIKAGDAAPEFRLKSPDGKQEVALSDFRGQRPVALIFGSYT